MTNISAQDELETLGGTLEDAIRRQVSRPRHRGLKVGLMVALMAIAGVGTAAAAGVFTPRQVAAGMPAGSAIFGETNPRCVAADDGASFVCTLAHPPTVEVQSDYTGAKELLAVDQKIAGGCIGEDATGLRWHCYLGSDAVRMQILVQDLLGQPATAPGHG